MICQTGPNSHIAIENSRAIQIGHRNVMVRQAEDGESADRHQEQTLWGQLLPLGGGRDEGHSTL